MSVRNAYTLTDDVSWVMGRHNVRFGGSYNLTQTIYRVRQASVGNFTINGSATGNALADFMTGQITTFLQSQGSAVDAYNYFPSLYIQDDVRVNRRLTFNYGVRYEPYSPWKDKFNRVQIFSIPAFDAGERSKVFVNAPPGELFPGDPGVPKDGTTGQYTNVAPRAGFALDVFGDGKTSLRGGAGAFYDSSSAGYTRNAVAGIPPWNPSQNLNPPPGPISNPLRGISDIFPIPVPPPANSAFPSAAQVNEFDPTTNFHVPVTYNWNLTVERQLKGSWLARVAYVGSHANHIGETIQLNPAVYIPGSTRSVDQRRLFQTPDTALGIIAMASQDINSNYNSLQLTMEKRFTRSFSILANYTWSKSLDDFPSGAVIMGGPNGVGAASPIPWYMPGRHQFDYGPSQFDHRQRIVVSYLWQLPKLAGAPRLVGHVLGDWEATGILSAQTGDAFTILGGNSASQTGLSPSTERGVATGAAEYGTGACGNAWLPA